MSEAHTPKSLRAVTGKTQAQVAKRARVSVNTVANLEAGASVTLDNLGRVAKALRVDLSVLLAAWERVRKVRK